MRKVLSRSLLIGSLCVTFSGAMLQAQAPGGGAPQGSPSGQAQQPAAGPGGPGAGQNPGANAPAPKQVDDKKFAKNAAMGGLEEVELGKLATQKASSDAVKQFGQKMIDDHTKANDELKEVAQKDSLDLPQTLDSKHQAKVDKLSKLSGPAFDKAYAKDMVKDHEKDVSEFKNEAQNGTDPNIKQFASSTLPTLEQHLSMAKDLNKQEKGSKGEKSSGSK